MGHRPGDGSPPCGHPGPCLTGLTIQCIAHCGGHSPSGKFWLKFNFSAHMKDMELLFLGGLQKMCMFHEPAGFWPTIFVYIFLGALKSHFPVSQLGQPGTTSEEEVNWSSFNFTATSRKHFAPENARFCCNSLQKSEKMHVFEALSG